MPVTPEDEAAEERAFQRVRERSIGVGEAIAAEEGGCALGAEIAAALGISERDLERLLAAHEVFRLPEGYPRWQLRDGRVLPGLREVLRALAEQGREGYAVALFWTTSAEALDGKRPLDLLRAGKLDGVLRHVERWCGVQ